jgi:hypothetical protein
MSPQQRIRVDRVAIVDRINYDLQRFRLVGDLVQVDDFDAAERLAVVVDERAALPATTGRDDGMAGPWRRLLPAMPSD